MKNEEWGLLISFLSMSNIICVGSVAKDIFFPTGEGEFLDTPEDVTAQRKVAFEVGAKYQVEDRYEAVGGVAANTSVGLARLGLSVSCCGATGDDDIGLWIRNELEREGVDIGNIEIFPETKSDLSSILVFTKDGERTIFYNRDSAERFHMDASKLSGASWVVVSALNGEWRENLRNAVSGVRSSSAKLVVNPGQRNMKDDPELLLEVMREADVLLLNKDEAIELVARISESPASLNDETFLMRSLFGHGAKVIALTDGMRGAWGYDGREMLRAVSRKPERGIDTTGAGDAFGSAFLAATVLGKPLSESLVWGMLNGASVVRHFGAIEGLLRRNEIESHLDDIAVEFLK